MLDYGIGGVGQVMVDQRRTRETPKNVGGFRTALAQGANLLLSGAAAATGLVGGPAFSAAISRVQASTGSSIAAITDGTANGDIASIAAGNTDGTTGDPLLTIGQTSAINDDLKLLALQEQLQRQNRQIALASNVMKAKHDTAKAAISNMRP